VLETIDAFANYLPGKGKGHTWRPWTSSKFLIPIALDPSGNPVNNQVFVKFQGRIGAHATNKLTSAVHFDGGGLSGCRWAYMKSIGSILDEFLVAARSVGSDFQKAVYDENGPVGFGSRDYVLLDSWYPGSLPTPPTTAVSILDCFNKIAGIH